MLSISSSGVVDLLSFCFRPDGGDVSTSIVDVRGFDSSIMLNLRGGIPRPTGNLPESLSQAT